MKTLSVLSAFAIVVLLASAPVASRAQQPPASKPATPTAPAVAIDGNAIGGVVTSRFGPEAGVWVVAETRDLGTRFAKMVVTDERGAVLLHDAPERQIGHPRHRRQDDRVCDRDRVEANAHGLLTLPK